MSVNFAKVSQSQLAMKSRVYNIGSVMHWSSGLRSGLNSGRGNFHIWGSGDVLFGGTFSIFCRIFGYTFQAEINFRIFSHIYMCYLLNMRASFFVQMKLYSTISSEHTQII